jgi:hypothetical protein
MTVSVTVSVTMDVSVTVSVTIDVTVTVSGGVDSLSPHAAATRANVTRSAPNEKKVLLFVMRVSLSFVNAPKGCGSGVGAST